MATFRKTLIVAALASAFAAPIAKPRLCWASGNPATPETVSLKTANSWLEIDAAAFGRNLEAVKKMLGGKQKICAVIKGDAYGNSIELLMPQIIKHKIPCVGITSNDEARVVRASGYKGTVARLRTTTLGEIEDGFQYNIEELFGNLKAAQLADARRCQTGQKTQHPSGA